MPRARRPREYWYACASRYNSATQRWRTLYALEDGSQGCYIRELAASNSRERGAVAVYCATREIAQAHAAADRLRDALARGWQPPVLDRARIQAFLENPSRALFDRVLTLSAVHSLLQASQQASQQGTP